MELGKVPKHHGHPHPYPPGARAQGGLFAQSTSTQSSRATPETNRARVNEKIRVPQVLLIDETGEKVGVIATDEARSRAAAAEMDLVEVAASA